MNIKPYWNYFKYVMEHKKNVFIECWRSGLCIHAFTHDLSKFLPSEFIPYTKYFYIDKQKYNDEFEIAWRLHYTRNKHHWNYWNIDGDKCFVMPDKYIYQMIADWNGMSRKFGGTSQQFYLNNYHKIKLHRDSRYYLEIRLGLLDDYNAPICEGNTEYWETLEETAKRYTENYNRDNKGFVEPRACFNDLHKSLCEKYNVDLYKIVMG